ncbi:MAG: Na+/H+ antiporter [Flavihumibacter sp.]
MLEHQLLLVIVLFFLMALLYLFSQRLKISYPIFLVIGGLGISFLPHMPHVNVNPDLVFTIFLPPLLFEAAWLSSWRELWKWRRSILLLGFGLVLVTSAATAWFSVMIIPGFTLAMGFLLGGIISPPDAVAAASVLKGMDVPRRGLTILEGESLVNDAASLTIFRFALAAIVTGNFVVRDALVAFSVLSVMGIVVGLAIAHVLYFILKYWAKDTSITTPMTLIAPYLMYMAAEAMEWSGVLAVVSGGLFLSFRAHDFLRYNTRIQTREVWSTVGFLLNGFVFILIGLELPVIINSLEGYSIKDAIWYAMLISLIVIVIRIVLVYLAAYIPRWLSPKIREREKSPGMALPFIIGWAGMRGVVSLASALAIPLTLPSGAGFPHRNIILFITFVVILVTLVFQGMTLPLFIRWMNVKEIDEHIPEEEQIEAIRLELAKQAVAYLDANYHYEMEQYESIHRLKEQFARSIAATENAARAGDRKKLVTVRGLVKKISLELISLRREQIQKIRLGHRYDEEVIRILETNLDLEEARLSKA